MLGIHEAQKNMNVINIRKILVNSVIMLKILSANHAFLC